MTLLVFKVWLTCAFVMLLMTHLDAQARVKINKALEDAPQEHHVKILMITYALIALFSPIFANFSYFVFI